MKNTRHKYKDLWYLDRLSEKLNIEMTQNKI